MLVAVTPLLTDPMHVLIAGDGEVVEHGDCGGKQRAVWCGGPVPTPSLPPPPSPTQQRELFERHALPTDRFVVVSGASLQAGFVGQVRQSPGRGAVAAEVD